jgi:hypothetical protein
MMVMVMMMMMSERSREYGGRTVGMDGGLRGERMWQMRRMRRMKEMQEWRKAFRKAWRKE